MLLIVTLGNIGIHIDNKKQENHYPQKFSIRIKSYESRLTRAQQRGSACVPLVCHQRSTCGSACVSLAYHQRS